MAQKTGRSLKRRATYRAGGCVVAFGTWLAEKFPQRWTDRWGMWLGRLGRLISRKHRERTESNLRMCYPDWSDEQVTRTAKRVFEHFGKTAMRFLRGVRTSDEEVLSSIDPHGIEHLDEALALGKGVLMVSAHFGNWERGVHYLALKGYKVSVVARDANDAEANALINRKRNAQGVEVFSRGSAAREIITRLKNNECVGILPDQNSNEVFVPFFGKLAGTVTGPAVFHLRTGAPIIGTFCSEKPDGRYHGEIVKLEIPEATGDKDEDVRRITAAINEMIENAVRKHPEQWLWMHDRWKAARNQGLLDA